jgi:predicted dehydrogenase
MDNRRGFLSKTGAAVIYTLADSAFKLRAAGPNDQLGFGFIGSGIRGSELLGYFKRLPGVHPLIVADLYDGCLQRAKEQTDGAIETTKDYHDVLSRKDVDAVVIAAPDHWHKQMVLDSLAAGKHVYIEKPMTWSIDEGKQIIDAVEGSGRVLQVGSQPKTSALAAKTREIVQSGALGKVNMVRMQNHRNSPEGAWVYPIPPDASPKTVDWDRFLGPAPKRTFDPAVFFRWRCWWDYSGGVATDLFVHLLTWLHEVMDVTGPKSVVSQGGLYHWKDGRNVPDVMNSIFEYDGFIADMYVNLCNAHSMHGNVIMGTEGTLVEERGKLVLYPENHTPNVQRYGSEGWPEEMRAAYFESHGYTADGRPKSPLPPRKKPEEITIESGPSHYEYFVMSIREGLPSRETATEGHYAAGAGHLANLAYRKGRRMRWNLETGEVSEA